MPDARDGGKRYGAAHPPGAPRVHALVAGGSIGVGPFGRAPGATTEWAIFHTDSRGWGEVEACAINGAIASTTALAPIPEVHETALLAGLGLCGLAFWRRIRA